MNPIEAKLIIELDDETQPLTEALEEAIHEDTLSQWEEKERWHSLNGGADVRHGDTASPEHGDHGEDSNSKTGRSSGVGGGSRNSTTSEEGFHSPAITSTNLNEHDTTNVNNSDMIDDDSNSTSGVENGPKDDYFDEEEDPNPHELVATMQTNGHHHHNNFGDDDGDEEQQLLGTIKRRSLVKDNEVLIEALDEVIRVDEDNNICHRNSVGGGGGVANGGNDNIYTKKQAPEVGNGNYTLFVLLPASDYFCLSVACF